MTTPKPMPADPHQDPLARVEAVLARSIKELGIFDGLLEAITADGAISPRAPVATLAGGAATVKADLEGLLADLRSGALLISERPAGDRVEAVNGGKLWSLIRSKLPDFAERYSKTDRYEIGSAITDAAARDLAQQIIALLALGPAEGK